MELDELVEEIDIVEYIGQFVDLEQRGEEYWGISPFTDPPEKTPSFSVRQNPPSFYDFSSGIGGNVFTFVRYYDRCSHEEAKEILESYAGVSGEAQSGRRFAATKIARSFSAPKKKEKKSEVTILPDDYMNRFERSDEHLKVWTDEGISSEVLDKFQVRYDYAANRIVYPIRDVSGNIVNIGGRTCDPDYKSRGLKKYNYYFMWGRIETMYGLFENLHEIKQKHEVILFEGCKSVLKAETWGIGNTAAILTSHLSPEQMKILARLGCRVVFALDKDIDIRKDRHINQLKRYVNVSYIYDSCNLLGAKDSPVDRGEETFRKLYEQRYYLR